MYQLNQDQIDSLENFIGKIPESLIRGRIERCFTNLETSKRVTTDDMETFVGLSTHLPVELQHFPISFALAVKNGPETERREAAGEVTEQADLTSVLDESIADVPDADVEDDEAEHDMPKQKRTKSKSKAKIVKRK